ncbi:hypothetical protein NIIDNTM18_06000 [Mycolicibacterium litorale]|uniref:Uncharacterized protein n=1 Tax=Mycolicibacterium litorale TaxID=758802 RepID=A0A6S6NZP0_9MYCO|nr:hypothetical protein NIIDNTM18_06000 [Mycolicibacterium litorale]
MNSPLLSPTPPKNLPESKLKTRVNSQISASTVVPTVGLAKPIQETKVADEPAAAVLRCARLTVCDDNHPVGAQRRRGASPTSAMFADAAEADTAPRITGR